MATIDPESLLPNDHVQAAALSGDVTQISRGASNRYAEGGDTFDLDGTAFEVTSVEDRTLGHERNAMDNLVSLCVSCHISVDRNGETLSPPEEDAQTALGDW